jgi:co-chaperonin GroES (HSP10)
MVIWDAVNPYLRDITPVFQNVLIATYLRPEAMTEGGIAVPHEVIKDDNFQSKVGLVLKVGHTAFHDDEKVKFGGFSAKPGDWVVFRASDGLRMAIGGPGGHEARLIPDVHIKMVLDHPDAIF